MIPQIIQLGPIPINSFGLMVALALIAASFRLARSFAVVGVDPSLGEKYVFVAGISGLIGARIWFLAEHYDTVQNDFVGALFSSAGFTFYGGLIISFVVMWCLCRLDKVPFAKYLDASGPSMALGYAIGRVGCQLSGDGDYGMATTSIFGMAFPDGTVPTPPGILAFPTPLYESILALLILWIVTKVESKPEWSPPLRRFGLYLTLISLERFVVEFLRINPRIIFGFSEAQLIALVFTSVGFALLLRTKPREVIRYQ